MLLQPLLPGALEAVAADLLRIVLGLRRLAAHMLRAHVFPEFIHILGNHGTLQGPLVVMGVFPRSPVLGLGALVEPEPLALVALQVDRGHHVETGLQDSGHLHIPLGECLLLPHPLIHILQRQDRIVPGALVPAEIRDHGHIPVSSPRLPLAQHIQLMHSRVPGLDQALQGELLPEHLPVLRMDLVHQAGLQDHVPHQRLGAPALLAVSALPHQVHVPVLQIDGIYPQVLLSQRPGDLLEAHAGLIQLQALLEHVLYILDIDQDGLVPVRISRIRGHLQQVPAVASWGAAPVAAGQVLPPGLQHALEILHVGEAQEPVQVVRMDGALFLELLQPFREALLLAVYGPFLRARLHYLIAVAAQVHPQDLAVDIAEFVRMGGQRDDQGRDAALPLHAPGLHVHRAQHIVADDGFALLPLAHVQQRTVGAGVRPHPVAGRPLLHIGSHPADTFVKI